MLGKPAPRQLLKEEVALMRVYYAVDKDSQDRYAKLYHFLLNEFRFLMNSNDSHVKRYKRNLVKIYELAHIFQKNPLYETSEKIRTELQKCAFYLGTRIIEPYYKKVQFSPLKFYGPYKLADIAPNTFSKITDLIQKINPLFWKLPTSRRVILNQRVVIITTGLIEPQGIIHNLRMKLIPVDEFSGFYHPIFDIIGINLANFTKKGAIPATKEGVLQILGKLDSSDKDFQSVLFHEFQHKLQYMGSLFTSRIKEILKYSNQRIKEKVGLKERIALALKPPIPSRNFKGYYFNPKELEARFISLVFLALEGVDITKKDALIMAGIPLVSPISSLQERYINSLEAFLKSGDTKFLEGYKIKERNEEGIWLVKNVSSSKLVLFSDLENLQKEVAETLDIISKLRNELMIEIYDLIIKKAISTAREIQVMTESQS